MCTGSRGNVPDADRAVEAGSRQVETVRGVGEVVHDPLVPLEHAVRAVELPFPEVPLEAAKVDTSGAIGTIRRQDFPHVEGGLAPTFLDPLHVGDVDAFEQLPARVFGLPAARQGLMEPPVGLPCEVRRRDDPAHERQPHRRRQCSDHRITPAPPRIARSPIRVVPGSAGPPRTAAGRPPAPRRSGIDAPDRGTLPWRRSSPGRAAPRRPLLQSLRLLVQHAVDERVAIGRLVRPAAAPPARRGSGPGCTRRTGRRTSPENRSGAM